MNERLPGNACSPGPRCGRKWPYCNQAVKKCNCRKKLRPGLPRCSEARMIHRPGLRISPRVCTNPQRKRGKFIDRPRLRFLMWRIFTCPEGARENSQGQRPWNQATYIELSAPTGRRIPTLAVRTAHLGTPLGLSDGLPNRVPRALPLAILPRPFGAGSLAVPDG